MAWQLRIAKQAARKLKKVPRKDQERIAGAIAEMRANPFRGDIARLSKRLSRLAPPDRELPDLLRYRCERIACRCNRYSASDDDHVLTQVHDPVRLRSENLYPNDSHFEKVISIT